jgi:pimeloyl-ACP methyl ester carboxylesterase
LGLVSLALADPAPVKTTALGRGPTLVLLHSMGGTRATWTPTVKKLVAGHRVITVDLPGHGESLLPDPFSLEAAAESVDQMLGTLPPDSTIVVGQGMGGVLALMALTAHPERARGLVLIDASLVSPFQVSDQQRETTIAYVDANYDAFLRSTFGQLGRDSVQSMQIHAQAAQVAPATMKAYFAAMLGLDATQTIRSAHPPIVAIGTERIWPADRDSLTFVKQMGYQGATGLTVRRLARCGLLVASEQPDSLAAVIRDFATRHIGRK